MHHDLQEQAQGIHEQMAFASIDLLATIVAVRARALSRPDRLTSNAGRAGGRLPPCTLAHLLPQGRVEPLPGAIKTPFSEIVIPRRPGWKLTRQEAPLAATAQHVEEGIEDPTEIA